MRHCVQPAFSLLLIYLLLFSLLINNDLYQHTVSHCSGHRDSRSNLQLVTRKRTVELSLQSSFQLSLTVLVHYRSRKLWSIRLIARISKCFLFVASS